MPDQCDNRRGLNGVITAWLEAGAGLWLYLLTLALEAAVGGLARWVVVYLAAVSVGAIGLIELDRSLLAWVAAVAPIVFSLSGLLFPGDGRWWRHRGGLRRPSAEELETLTLAFELFARARSLPPIAVLDDPFSLAAVRGTTLIVSRGLIESSSLPAVLAHEQGHLRSLDGRLTEALQRLSVWEDPLGSSSQFEAGSRAGSEPVVPAGHVYSLLRLTLRLTGGGQVQKVLGPLWGAYWRRREFIADAGAAALGQGPDLTRHLRDEVLPLEVSRRLRVFNFADHPPTALRIERLEEAGRPGGTK
jgi:Zn-dependent protease with chaperone function